MLSQYLSLSVSLSLSHTLLTLSFSLSGELKLKLTCLAACSSCDASREREKEKKGGLPSGVVFKAHVPIKTVTLTIELVSRLIDAKPVEIQSRDTSVGMRVMSIGR
jgi:hypothetical protein